MTNENFILNQSHEYTLEPLKNRYCKCQYAETLTATEVLSLHSELQSKSGHSDGTVYSKGTGKLLCIKITMRDYCRE
jgi:hypothetical protein